MKIVYLIVISFTLALTISCSDHNIGTVTNKDLWSAPVELKFTSEQKIYNPTSRLGIHFVKVKDDSRCPAEVQCVWAGDATAMFDVLHNDETVSSFEVSLSHPEKEIEVEQKHYIVKLASVDPYPSVSKVINPEEYRVSVKVTPQ